jgi:hypothetical protein
VIPKGVGAMKKVLILFSSALLLAVGAALPKEKTALGYDDSVFTGSGGPIEADAAPAPTVGGYPPCSRTVTDRCIQLYERAVRAAMPRQAARRPGGPAVGGPIERRENYPGCTTLITDECVEMFDSAPHRAPAQRRRRAAPSGEADTPGI